MFCPRPLHQLPELPSHVFSECAACLEQRSSQTAPFSNSKPQGELPVAGPSALHCLPFTAPPGSFFSLSLIHI